MNLPILQSEVKTMSSKDLLELINQIRQNFGESPVRLNDFNNRIIDELDGQHYENFVVQNLNNTQSTYFNLTIEQCTLVGMRESKGVRRSVLEKLKQLEQPQIALPQDYLSALKALVTSEEQKQALAIENQALKPKADAYDRFLDSDGLMTSGVIGKLLGYKSAQEFNDAIHAKGVAFKSSGVWQFYASFKDKHIGKMVGWEREEFNKAGVTLKWKTVAIDYFSSLLGRPVVQKELLDA